MSKHYSGRSLFATLAFLWSFGELAANSLVLEPSQDNTLYETPIDDGIQPREMSNGAGSYLFAGRTKIDAGFKLRRGLLQFDLSSLIPDTAVIVYAELSMYQSKAAPGASVKNMTLHRVLQAWGEGTSDAFGAEGQGNFPETDDATWHHRLYPDTLWTTAGGVHAATATAGTNVGQLLQTYIWSCNAEMLTDLNDWLQNPALNFGWLIKGGEGGGSGAHRFNSRENNNIDQRPKLTLIFHSQDATFADSFETVKTCP